MKSLIKKLLRESLVNSQSSKWNICDDFSVSSYDELIDLLKQSEIEQEDWDNIQDMLDELKSGLSKSSNYDHQSNTITHKIASRLCK